MAQSVSPVNGAWFDPDENGRGLTLELRNGILVLTFFGYGQDGEAKWWQGVGREDVPLSGIYTGVFAEFSNGQCIGCEYRFPDATAENEMGQFTMEFTSSETAVFTWADGISNYQSLNFAYPTDLNYFKGAFMWTAVDDLGFLRDSGIYIIDGEENGVVTGRTSGSFLSSDTDSVIGSFEGPDDNGLRQVGFLREISNRTTLILASVDADKIRGKYWIFDTGSMPTGNGDELFGYRIFNEIEIIHGAGDVLGRGFLSNAKSDVPDKTSKEAQTPAPQHIIDLYYRLKSMK